MSENLESQLTAAGRAMVERGLVWGTTGNLSARLEGGRMLVSASGTALGELQAGDLVTVNLSDGRWSGTRKPSKEVPMHVAIYGARTDAQVVLHSSPHYTTLLACSNEAIPAELFIETMYYLERVAWVDYAHPGTAELGESVGRAAAAAEVVMMRNHGVIVFDRSAAEALVRLQVLEMACRIVVEAKAAGITLNRIPAERMREFLDSGRYKPRQSSRGGPP